MKNSIMNRAHRNLSNRADGADNETIVLMNADPNVDQGLDKTFSFTVENGDAEHNLAIAIVPAYYDTERITTTADGDPLVYTTVKTYDNITALNQAGFNVGAVLSDGVTKATINGKSVDVSCSSIDPTKTIKNFLDFIKLNPQRLKHMDIISNDANAFDGNLMITFCNPFYDNKRQTVQLSTFYSKYQYADDRIGIDFNENELEFSDLLLLTCVVPAGKYMKYILKFW